MTQIEKIMLKLGCSEAEAKDIVDCDKAIDKGGRVYFDLSPEEEKEAKKFINVKDKKKPTVYDFSKKRERKPNEEKGELIANLFDYITSLGLENPKITNKERQIAFSVGENDYELTLVQKRKKKE